jgi:hypothetical protein
MVYLSVVLVAVSSMMGRHHRDAHRAYDDSDDQRGAPTERHPDDRGESEDGQHGDDAACCECEQGDEAEPVAPIRFGRGAHGCPLSS